MAAGDIAARVGHAGVLEDGGIKIDSVASALTTLSARDMIEALINGERDPAVLADPDEEIDAYELVVARYGDDPAPALREQVAGALTAGGGRGGCPLGVLN